jgi:hypothetical protein
MGKKTKIQIINIKYTNFVIFLTFVTALLLSALFYLTIQIPNSYANNNVIKIINQKTIQDQNNYKHLIGILKNIGNSSINDIIISANFLDKANKSIGNFSKQSEITTINPNDTSPFDILIYDKIIYDKIKNFNVNIKYNNTKHKEGMLNISSNNSHMDTNGFYFINGEIQNNGNMYSNNTTVTAITYDKNKEILGVWKAQTEPYIIPPLSTASFSIPITDKIQSFKISNYKLLAESDKYTTKL